MSPLTEKLAAILDDWDQLSAILSDVQHQCASKDGTIAGLQQTIATQQQQLNKQASELAAMKAQLSSLQAQATAALLTASDPDDAKLQQRIESAFQSVSGKPGGSRAPISSGAPPTTVSSSPGQGPVRPATPTAFSEVATPSTSVSQRAVSGSGRLVIPGRSITGNGSQRMPQPQPQPAHATSASQAIATVAKNPQGGGIVPVGSSKYSSSEEAS